MAVLVPVLPREPALEGSGHHELGILRSTLGSRVEVIAPQWVGRKLALDSIVVRIRQDIAPSH